MPYFDQLLRVARILSLIAGCFFALSVNAQTRWSNIDSSRVSWISNRVLVLDERAAVSKWADEVGKARVVALGEATHGDGAAFELRNILTRSLHERSEFNRLALEALGAFDSADSLKSGSAYLWSASEQAWPGLEFAMASSDLSVHGMDVQHRHHRSYWVDIDSFLTTAGIADPSWAVVRSTLESAFGNPFVPVPEDLQEEIKLGVARISSELTAQNKAEWGRFLRNALANAATAWEQSYAPRNRQMADNILALSGERNKVIVWAASSHTVRSLEAIDTMTDAWSYDGSRTVGSELTDQLGEDYRVIAFAACGGTYGASHIRLSESQIAPPTEGSLEDLICSVPFEQAAYLDLRLAVSDPNGGWLNAPLLAGPLGYSQKRASWPLALDGLIVMRSMSASTPRDLE